MTTVAERGSGSPCRFSRGSSYEEAAKIAGIPRTVQDFIIKHIHSVEQLEVLLLLREHSDIEWTPAKVARELRATESAIELRLRDLNSRGFLSKNESDAYRYSAPPNAAASIDDLATVYRSRRTGVIELIFSGPSASVQSFADAFRLGREEDG